MGRQRWIALAIAIGICLGFAAVTGAQDDRPKPIVKPADLNSEEKIVRFLMTVLQDRTRRADPFVKGQERSTRQVAQYAVEDKPRPASGFGRYDVETLTLQAIWKEETAVVAMVKAPDGKVFIVKVGEEAYDGRLVEISPQGGYIKFLQELRRTSGPARPGEPDIKYVEKIVRFRR
jgi:hypothetical protein